MSDPSLKPLSAGKRAKLEKKRSKLVKKLAEVDLQLSAPAKVAKPAKADGKKTKGRKTGKTPPKSKKAGKAS